MARKILVYGHGDKSESGFPEPEDLEGYIEGGVFVHQNGRYRYSQSKRADIIVLSQDDLAFGHFEVESMEPPSKADKEAYPPVKQVYLVANLFDTESECVCPTWAFLDTSSESTLPNRSSRRFWSWLRRRRHFVRKSMPLTFHGLLTVRLRPVT